MFASWVERTPRYRDAHLDTNGAELGGSVVFAGACATTPVAMMIFPGYARCDGLVFPVDRSLREEAGLARGDSDVQLSKW